MPSVAKSRLEAPVDRVPRRYYTAFVVDPWNPVGPRILAASSVGHGLPGAGSELTAGYHSNLPMGQGHLVFPPGSAFEIYTLSARCSEPVGERVAAFLGSTKVVLEYMDRIVQEATLFDLVLGPMSVQPLSIDRERQGRLIVEMDPVARERLKAVLQEPREADMELPGDADQIARALDRLARQWFVRQEDLLDLSTRLYVAVAAALQRARDDECRRRRRLTIWLVMDGLATTPVA